MVMGNFGDINKGFKQLLAGSLSEADNMTPANWTDIGKRMR